MPDTSRKQVWRQCFCGGRPCDLYDFGFTRIKDEAV